MGNGVRVLVDTTPDLSPRRLASTSTAWTRFFHPLPRRPRDGARRGAPLQRAAAGGRPCYGDARTLQELRRTFAYIFERRTRAEASAHPPLSVQGPFSIGARRSSPCRVARPPRDPGVPGTDSRISPTAAGFPTSRGPCSRASTPWPSTPCATGPHPDPFHGQQALEVSGRLGARRTWLTHICHDLRTPRPTRPSLRGWNWRMTVGHRHLTDVSGPF